MASDTTRTEADATAEPVLLSVDGAVARLTLNRPDQRNPLDWSSVRRLKDAVERIEAMPAVRVVVVRGAGGHFSAGGDLKGYIDLYRRPADFRRFLEDFHAMLAAIEGSAKVYLAVVDGYCVAGGIELMLACDIVFAAGTARIGDAHVNFGQLPGAGGSQRLPRTIGPMRARWLMLTGETLEAAECERIGLVSKAVPDAEVDATLERTIRRLSAASPLGLAGMKRLTNRGLAMDIDSALRMELDYVADYATTSNDAMEGLIAFQEKRRPRFSGT